MTRRKPPLVLPASTTPADVVQRLLAAPAPSARSEVLSAALAAGDPEPLLTALKDEAERQWSIDPHASLLLAEVLIHGARVAGRPRHHALGLMAKGDALRNLGRFQEAHTCLEEAGDAFRALGDDVGWARTRIGWLHVSHLLGRAAEALPTVERARAVLMGRREWLRAASLSTNAAVVSYELGRYQEALDLYDRAIALYEAARQDNPRLSQTAESRIAKASMNKAIVHTFLAQFESARPLHEAARRTFHLHGDTMPMLQADTNLAYLHLAQGRFSSALHLLGEAAALAHGKGLAANAAWATLGRAEVYLSIGRFEDALSAAREAANEFEQLGTMTELAKSRHLAARALTALGRNDDAIEELRSAEVLFAAAGLDAHIGLAALLRATLHTGRAEWPAACDEAMRADRLFADRGLALRQAEARVIHARALLALGQPEEASQAAAAALAITKARHVGWLDHQAHHILAGAASARGDTYEALARCDCAVESIERVQRHLATELRTHFLADKLRIYQDAIDYALRLGLPERAFGYLERAKSRSLVDFLADNSDVQPRARTPATQRLVSELARLRDEHHSLYSRLRGFGVLGDTREHASDAEAEVLQEAIAERERQIARLLERLAVQDAEALEGLAPSYFGHPAPPRLDAGTVLLEYYLHAGACSVFVVTDRGVEVVPLSARSTDVTRLLSRWQIYLGAAANSLRSGRPLHPLTRNARGLLSDLYTALLAPVAHHVDSCRRLVVVPHGPTHAVPFHALYDGSRYLVERVELSTCPSSSILERCAARAPSSDSAFVVAHSADGRLPFVLEEANAVASLFPGQVLVESGATRDVVLAEAPRHGIVHLAAHAEARLDNPAFGHVRLADGQLTAHDAFNLRLDGALVTLSACDTGRGVVSSGDEVLGLSRGFLYAGASSIVQSLWRVDDRSTARLMRRFYEALRAGRPKGGALREAQLALLAEVGAEPYFWAPFQLVGHSGPFAPRTAQ